MIEEIARMVREVGYAKRHTLRVGLGRYQWLKEQALESEAPFAASGMLGLVTGVEVIIDPSLSPMEWKIGDE